MPFEGVGLYLPEFRQTSPSLATVESLAGQFGFDKCVAWIYLTYVCWAGEIDFVYGISRRQNDMLGPIGEGDENETLNAYLKLMSHFGISKEYAINFQPFHRGYWGE